MEHEESSWINIADIMSALMMIFMFIAIGFLYEIMSQEQVYKVELNEALHKEFDKNLKEWGAEITDDNIIRFNAPFRAGSQEPEHDFNAILSNFFPRYIKLLSIKQFKEEIMEVRVEGHTSDTWGDVGQKQAYLLNMELSQKRATNVLKYCYELEDRTINQNLSWLQKVLRANGMSFSKLLYKDENQRVQDNERSRRVEFKVVVKEHEV
jgi:outer membrane protein OmpA-like peptidoglycan-associated protein